MRIFFRHRLGDRLLWRFGFQCGLRFRCGNFEPIEQVRHETCFALNIFAQDLDAIVRRGDVLRRHMLLELGERLPVVSEERVEQRATRGVGECLEYVVHEGHDM